MVTSNKILKVLRLFKTLRLYQSDLERFIESQDFEIQVPEAWIIASTQVWLTDLVEVVIYQSILRDFNSIWNWLYPLQCSSVAKRSEFIIYNSFLVSTLSIPSSIISVRTPKGHNDNACTPVHGSKYCLSARNVCQSRLVDCDCALLEWSVDPSLFRLILCLNLEPFYL